MKSNKDNLDYNRLISRISFMRTFLAITIGILLSIVIIFFVSDNPLLSIKYLVIGPILNKNNFFGLVVTWIPIVITGLAVCVMFSANQFNLFVEGGFFFGGVIAAMVALSTNLPKGVHALVCVLAAALVCGLICAIPAIMKYKLNSSEMVVSIMLNYLCLNLGLFLISTYFKDVDAGSVVSKQFPESALISELFPKSNIHIGLIVAILLVIGIYLFLYKTRWGYEIRIIGENPKFAKYAGISVGFVTVLSQMIGGALAGAAGAMDTLGLYSRFSWTALTNHGWDGVTLAILANRNPKFIPLAAFFLAYLRKGADLMSMKTGMQIDFVSIIQAVILIFILAENFLSGYRQKQVVKLSERIEKESAV